MDNLPQSHDDKYPTGVVNYNCYSLIEKASLRTPLKNNSLFSFHFNTWSLNKNLEALKYLLRTTIIYLDIAAITETRIRKNTSIVKNRNIPKFLDEFTLIELTAGGTLL